MKNTKRILQLTEHYIKDFAKSAEVPESEIRGKVWVTWDGDKRMYCLRGEGLPAAPSMKEQYPNGWSMLDYITPEKARCILHTAAKEKSSKRILKVTLLRILDTDADTSEYGEYGNKPTSAYSIDRATNEFQGNIDNGRGWLQRIEARLDDAYNEALEGEEYADNVYADVLQDARDTISEASEEFDNVSWNNREYRYFNPSDNYIGEPSEDILKYVRQDYERMEAYNRQEWHYVGIRAEATYVLKSWGRWIEEKRMFSGGCGPIQKLTSGGLWGIESDSDDSHFEETEREQLSELKEQLLALGFSKRAVANAFKSVERKDA